MAQFGAVTSAPIPPDSKIQVIRAWLAARPLEAQRLLAEAGLGYREAGEIIAALSRSNVDRKWRL
jgi:hypothetical protein